MKKILVAVFVMALLVFSAPVGTAYGKSLEQKYTDLRVAVIKQHGKRAPGRNIRKQGLRTPHGRVIQAQPKHFAKSIRQLRRILHPPVYLKTSRVGPPAHAPAGTKTPYYAPTGLAACIIAHESGGSTGAVNGQYRGIAQWSPYVWARDGGLQYAPEPTQASYQEQLQVLSHGLATHGGGDWTPYDGC